MSFSNNLYEDSRECMVFVSHRSLDADFADFLVTLLIGCGVPSANIFCSSLPGNDVKRVISPEIKNALQSSRLDIVILSSDFYASPYCQQEAGAIWAKGRDIIVIALPDIDDHNMQGFLNNDYLLRRLDNRDDMFGFYDVLKQAIPELPNCTAKLNTEIDKLIRNYKRLLRDGQASKEVEVSCTETQADYKIIFFNRHRN